MKKSLRRLVIDSATKHLYIGLFDGESKLGCFYEAGHNDHSVKLMTEIERLLNSFQFSVKDLDEILVGIGPGSYTGLRIGVVVAKMFGWNNNIPVKTVSSLAMIASTSNTKDLIISEIDARRGNSFLGVYKNTGKGLQLVVEEQLANLEEFKNKMKEAYKVVSVGEPNILKLLNSELIAEVQDIHTLNPNYLRKTEAERNLK